MKFKFRFGYLALFLTVLLLVWLFSGELRSSKDTAPASVAPVTEQVKVGLALSAASPYRQQVVLQGQVHPWQSIELRAQVNATVTGLPMVRGARVEQGAVLLELSEDDRRTRLQQAVAQRTYNLSQLEAAQFLRRQGLNAETELLRLKNELALAEQAVRTAELALAHTRPKAAFAGVLDQLEVDLGDYLTAGDVWGRLVDTSVLRIRAQVPQQQVAHLALGQPVQVELLDRRRLEGSVSHIAQEADSATRSYRVEIRVANPQGLRVAGASVTVMIDTGTVDAHQVSTALLTLDEGGQIGVLALDEDDRVQFVPVRLLSTGTGGSWVTGLPSRIRLITLGGGFVSPGEQVSVYRSVESG